MPLYANWTLIATYMSTMSARWRLELFFKSHADLRAQLPFLRAHQHAFLGVNLTNKSKDDDVLGSLAILRQELPTLDVCLHYSIRYNYSRSPQQTLTSLTTFLEALEAQGDGCSALLVSGSGQRKGLDTVSALQRLATAPVATARGAPLYVAFNPYLQDLDALQREFERLRSKLAADPARVRGVYLQMGCDKAALEAGLDHLNAIKTDIGISQGNLEIYGSVFLPTRRLLAQMRFRPWAGVFLSEEYLSGVEGAEAVTARLLEVYRRRGVIPLLESSVRTADELTAAQRLLGVLDSIDKP